MDLYRISDIEEFHLLGAEEMIYGNGVSLVEWSEKGEELLPDETIRIAILIEPDGSRSISLEGITL